MVRAHGVVVGQLRRYAQTCQHYSDFKHRVQTLTTRLLAQAFTQRLLEERIRLFFQENEVLVSKYGQKVVVCAKDSFKPEEEKKKEEETRERKRKRDKNRKKSSQKKQAANKRKKQ